MGLANRLWPRSGELIPGRAEAAHPSRASTRFPDRSGGTGDMRRRTVGIAIALAALGLLALATPAAAQVQPYGTNDYGGFRNILPPGQGSTVNALGLIQFQLNGSRPPHFDDQRLMYQDLIHATPGLTEAQIDDYFKDGSFGVRPADVERTYRPDPSGHPGLTVVRDNWGVPHVYGATRPDVMFGAGYIGAEDR